MNHSLVKRLRFLAELDGQHPIVFRDHKYSLTLEQFTDKALRLAKRIRASNAGVLALKANNSVDWVVVDFACQFCDVVFVPLPGYFSEQQLRYCLDTMKVELLLADSPVAEVEAGVDADTAHLQDWSDVTDYSVWQLPSATGADPVLPKGTSKVTFTSGSTGAPKGVCLSAEHQWRVAESLADAIAVRAPRHLCLLPLATLLENVGGVYTPLLCGGEVLLPSAGERGFIGSSMVNPAALLQCLDNTQPNTLILIPQLLKLLVAACDAGWRAPESLRFVAVGGGKVSPELLIRARGCGLPVYEGYGLSECGSVVALNTPESDAPGTVGRVLPHCQVSIHNREVVVSGAGFLGYVAEPESWYPLTVPTGDLGTLRDGHLVVTGRRKNLLISSYGRNINPEWVESEIAASPSITHCVVLGDRQPHLVALLGAMPECDDAAIEQWLVQVNARLPDYARVKNWARLDANAWRNLMTANGRPRRNLILEEYAPLISSLYESAESLKN